DTPPRLSAGHTPYYPTASNTTLVQIDASHAAGPPTLIQVVSTYPLVPGPPPTPADVHIENTQDTVAGNHLRRNLTLRADKTMGVEVRMTATVQAGGVPAVQTITHVIEFLGEPIVDTNQITKVEPNDDTGPAVIRSVPGPRGLLTLGDPILIRFDEPIDR